MDQRIFLRREAKQAIAALLFLNWKEYGFVCIFTGEKFHTVLVDLECLKTVTRCESLGISGSALRLDLPVNTKRVFPKAMTGNVQTTRRCRLIGSLFRSSLSIGILHAANCEDPFVCQQWYIGITCEEKGNECRSHQRLAKNPHATQRRTGRMRK